MKKIIPIIILLLFIQVCIGLLVYIRTEIDYVKIYVPETKLIEPKEEKVAFSIYGKDNLLMYRKYYKRSERLPKDYNMEKLAPIVDILVEDRYESIKKTGIERWKMIVLSHKGIDPFSLEGAVLSYYTDKLIFDNKLRGFKKELLRWYTTDKLNNKYDNNELSRLYLDSPAYAENVYGIAAASKYFFNKDIREIDYLEIAYLVSLITWNNSYLDPELDYQEIDRKAGLIIQKLYDKGCINKEELNRYSGRKVALHKEVVPTIEKAYVHAVLNMVKNNKDIQSNLGKKDISIYTGYNKKASDTARKVLADYYKGKDKKIQTAFVLVNASTQEVEVAIGSREYDTTVNRAITTSRQMASTFKPIVYLGAFEKGIRPTDSIVDKPYDFLIGDYVYSPKNYGDYFMGKIPIRYGFIFSLNNATVKLAERVGLNYVRNLSVDMGMNDKVRPFYAMALGAFPATPLNVAQIYSTIANLGERKLPNLITKIVIGDIEIDMKDKARRVVSKEAAYQTLYIMQDVARKGTARSVGMLEGTGAKTGTSNDVKDAWTAAIFGNYVAVSWVGYDNLSPITWGGSGGKIAAPIISSFQKAYFPKGTIFKAEPPENIVIKRVNGYSGRLTKKPYGRGVYDEAFEKDNIPEWE